MTKAEIIKRIQKLDELADAIKSETRVLLSEMATGKPKKTISPLQLSLNEMNRKRIARITKQSLPKTN